MQHNSQATMLVSPGGLVPDQLCKRCSSVPTTACPPCDLYCRSIDPPELARSPCRICRLIGRVMALYSPGPELYKLTWQPCSKELYGVIGNLSLVPLYVKHDALAAHIPVASVVAATSDTLDTILQHIYPENIDMNRVKTWLRDCDASPNRRQTTHLRCARDSQDSLQNLRLIDCHTRHIVAAPEHCSYVALSYVWGLPTDMIHTKGSKLPDDLPQTIEDSITVALMLGYTYIWIDRYCIEQMNSQDKHAQIKQMGIIYSAADLVVIAACGVDPTSGLAGISRTRRMNADFELLGSVTLINHQVHAMEGIQDSALASRAWTLQEGYLAKRRLYFTETQVVFICNEIVRTESEIGQSLQRQLLGTLGNSISPSDCGHNNSLDKATGLLEEYTKRQLSYQSDALDGISGAMEVLTSQDASLQHCYAVPFRPGRESRAYVKAQIGLNWVHLRQATRRAEFPSWSPLGWDGPVQFHGHHQMNVGFRDELDSLTSETRLLRVSGNCIKLSTYNPEDCPYKHYIILPELTRSTRLVLTEPFWDSTPTNFATDGTVYGMLLGRTGNTGPMILLFVKRAASYERIGCLPFHGTIANRTCRTFVKEPGHTGYRKIYLSQEDLEDVWRKKGVRDFVTLR